MFHAYNFIVDIGGRTGILTHKWVVPLFILTVRRRRGKKTFCVLIYKIKDGYKEMIFINDYETNKITSDIQFQDTLCDIINLRNISFHSGLKNDCNWRSENNLEIM